MRSLVLGCGLMGRVIAFGLHRLNFEVHTVDSELKNYDGEHLKYFHALDVSDPIELSDALNIVGDGVVVSSLPYYLNSVVADACINRDIAYCDLGGHVGTSNFIREAAQYSNKPMITDLGLAPGLVNIKAAEEVRLYIEGYGEPPKSVSMMVGGLPTHPQGKLKYKLTWSIDGLLNEYTDFCDVLVNGVKVQRPGMTGYEEVTLKIAPRYTDGSLTDDSLTKDGEVYNLECFRTSGGAAHSIGEMQELGVKNCEYKTLRYVGHLEAFQKTINKELEEDVKREILDECSYESNDIVIVATDIDGYKSTFTCKGNSKFTAMQMMTAFPIAAVAAQIAEGKYDGVKVVGYKDIVYDDFTNKFNYLMKATNERILT